MKGTEKQIKWANDIINKAYAALDTMILNYEKLDSYGDPTLAFDICKYTPAAVEAARKDLEFTFANVEDATMIIDIRNKLTYDKIKEMVINIYGREA